MFITYTMIQNPDRQRVFITDGQLNVEKLRDVGNIFINSMARISDPDVADTVAFDNLKVKLIADLDDEIQLIQQTIAIAAMVGLTVIGLVPAIEGKNPPSVMGLSMTVHRDGFREELWLETERYVEPDAEDYCPKDSEGLHFIGCGCDY